MTEVFKQVAPNLLHWQHDISEVLLQYPCGLMLYTEKKKWAGSWHRNAGWLFPTSEDQAEDRFEAIELRKKLTVKSWLVSTSTGLTTEKMEKERNSSWPEA